MKVAQLIGGQVGQLRLNFEKLYDFLAAHVVRAKYLLNLRSFSTDTRHIVRDKRGWESPVESTINS